MNVLLRFLGLGAVLLPLTFVIMAVALPVYSVFVGQSAHLLSSAIAEEPLRYVELRRDGLIAFNSHAIYGLGERNLALPIWPLVFNLPLFVGLMLAAPKQSWRECGRWTGAGIAIIIPIHICYPVAIVMWESFLRIYPEALEFVLLVPVGLWACYAGKNIRRDPVVDAGG